MLPYRMGHSEIGVTLNTYTHVKFEDVEEEMGKIFEVKPKRKNAM